MADAALEQRIERLEEVVRQIARSAQSATGAVGAPADAASGPRSPRGAVGTGAEGGVETYVAQGGQRGLLAAAAPGAASAFAIEVRFLGGLTQNQKNAFKAAADRWTRVIVGQLPAVTVGGEVIQGVLILAQGADIDGPGMILGQAGPTRLRPASAGSAAFIPAKGEMTFDSADLQQMEQRGTLGDVIAHEMGHVLGVGTIWSRKGLLQGAGTTNPTFVGTNAMREYGVLRGGGGPVPVPVENTGGQGTADSHWRDTVFGNELMTGFVGAAGNPLSRLTVASLQDLGYGVDMAAAEPYQLPNHLMMAEAGGLNAGPNELALGTMLSHIPIVLP